MIFHAHHGVGKWEKELGQRFEVDVDLVYDMRAAGKSDRLRDTVDFRLAYDAVKEVVSATRFNLLEALAERIAGILLERFEIDAVTVKVRKPHSPLRGLSNGVEVEIRRRRGE